jgi:secondary thiamine-phosphate synthase enzyme
MQEFRVQTHSRTEWVDITRSVCDAIRAEGIDDGLCLVFCPHTTAAITINENADPDVARDVLMEVDKIVPFQDGYHHGEGNSAAHIKSSLVGCSETLIVERGRPVLGTWQGIYFCEFDGPRNRRVHVKVCSASSRDS